MIVEYLYEFHNIFELGGEQGDAFVEQDSYGESSGTYCGYSYNYSEKYIDHTFRYRDPFVNGERIVEYVRAY